MFSFGVVFFEMLTGRQPFRGETVPDILASVLAREPELTRLPNDLNPRVAELLRRCLDKAPKKRWQAIGDVRAELRPSLHHRARQASARSQHRVSRYGGERFRSLRGIAISAAVTSAAWWFGTRPSADPDRAFFPTARARSKLRWPRTQRVGDLAGWDEVVYLAGDVAPAFYLRALDSTGVRLIPGTVGAGNSPCFHRTGNG